MLVLGEMPPTSKRRPRPLRRLAVFALPIVAATILWLAFGSGALGNPLAPKPLERAELVNVPGRLGGSPGLTVDSMTGYSGQIRARLLTREEVRFYPALTDRYGPESYRPGIRTIPYSASGGEFAFVTLKPWREKRGTFVNTYNVGFWPGEHRIMPSNYSNPLGFIEVTPEKADLRISTHFTLRDFLTHDQDRVWPKYVVLREELLDKLELVLKALEAQGVPTRHVVVLSGFRTPQYNLRLSFEGSAYASRHQFGDAADVIIDADRNGRMDDLNRDGVVNFQDTDVINRVVERVEKQYPEYVGGLGLYHAIGPTGPFAHIDVRGTRARWTNLVARSRRAPAQRRDVSAGSVGEVAPTGKCQAAGAFAALCVRSK